MQNLLLRNSLKLFVAALLTAAIAVWTERIQFAWYPLLAVVMVVDDNDDHTLKAASGRILGTVAGGLITFLVHTILGGWIGVLVSMLVMIPVLQLLGWQNALGTASLVAVMFLMLPGHTALGWDYVFNRALDTVVGCIVAILVGLLFWPQNSSSELKAADGRLRYALKTQLQAYSDWLGQGRSRPEPLIQHRSPATCSAWSNWWPRSAAAPAIRPSNAAAGSNGCGCGSSPTFTGSPGRGWWPVCPNSRACRPIYCSTPFKTCKASSAKTPHPHQGASPSAGSSWPKSCNCPCCPCWP